MTCEINVELLENYASYEKVQYFFHILDHTFSYELRFTVRSYTHIYF
jgi:hypothetical protein